MLNWKLFNLRQKLVGAIFAALLALGVYVSALNVFTAYEIPASAKTIFDFLSIAFLMMAILLHPLSFQWPSLEKFTSVCTPKICIILLLLAVACWLLPLATAGFLKFA
jgi:hypothetical protein